MQSKKNPNSTSLMHFGSGYHEDILSSPLGDSSRLPITGRFARFNGIDQYIVFSSTDVHDLTSSPLTSLFKLKYLGAPDGIAHEHAICIGDTTGKKITFNRFSSGSGTLICTQNSTVIYPNTPVGEWVEVMIIALEAAPYMKVYYNGIEQTATSGTHVAATSQQIGKEFTIARNTTSGTAQYANVDFDFFQLHAAELSVSQARRCFDGYYDLGQPIHDLQFEEGANAVVNMGTFGTTETYVAYTSACNQENIDNGKGYMMANKWGYAEVNDPDDGELICVTPEYTPDALDYDGALYTGSVKYPIKVNEHCVYFNGTDQSGTATGIVTSETEFTIDMWLYLNSGTTVDDDRIFSLGGNAGNRILAKREVSNDATHPDKLQLQNNTQTIWSNEDLIFDEWFRLRVTTHDSAPYVKAYVNDTELTFSGSFTSNGVNSPDTLKVAAWYTSTTLQLMEGYIAGIIVFEGTLTQDSVDNYWSNGVGTPLLVIPCTDGSGTSCMDISGNATDLSIINAASNWSTYQNSFLLNYRGYTDDSGVKVPLDPSNFHNDVISGAPLDYFSLNGRYLADGITILPNQYNAPELYTAEGWDNTTEINYGDLSGLSNTTYADKTTSASNIEISLP